MRFDNIKNQYQNDLLPLTTQKEALIREITELRASRDAYLEETTMLSARNEELAQLHAQYIRRMDTASESTFDLHGRDSSLEAARATRDTVSRNAEASTLKVCAPSTSGSFGKSSALYVFSL